MQNTQNRAYRQSLKQRESSYVPNKSLPSSSSSSSNAFNIYVVTTIAVGAISWIIAFVGSIAASQSLDYFPKFTWWGLVFELFIVIMLPIIYFLDMIIYYRSFLISLVAIGFVYTSNSTNNLVYYSDSSSSAAGTGFILLSIVNFLWLFYLGSDSQSPIISYIDSFGGPSSPSAITTKRMSSMPNGRFASNTYSYANGTQSTAKLHGADHTDVYSDNVHELAGFENPVSSENVTQMDDLELNDSAYRASGIMQPPFSNMDPEGTNFTGISSVSQYMEAYPILVRGLYDYNASPEDVNELSFKKGDVFRVKNTNGNWWQGKNKNGDIGMCPSNYLEIVT